MKSRTLPLFLVLAGGLLSIPFVSAQSAPPATAPTAPPQRRPMPKPVNLQVLPKDMTGEQVMDVMHKWEGALGVECSYCHTKDEEASAKAGRTRLKFSDDGKNEKKAARIMYTMTQDLNKKYISQLPEMGDPVSCGTCHRGHAHPQEFVPPPEHHEGPPPPAPPAK